MHPKHLWSSLIIAGGLIAAALIVSWFGHHRQRSMLVDSILVTYTDGRQETAIHPSGGAYHLELHDHFALAVPAEGSTGTGTVMIPYDNVKRIASSTP